VTGPLGFCGVELVVDRRRSITPSLQFLILVASLAAGLVAVGIVFAAKGVNPFVAIARIFSDSFGSAYGIYETITKAIPLVLTGGALVLAFKAKFWNIGAEGQLLLGATFATWVALNVGPNAPAIVVVPLMFLAGFVGGALLGSVPAVLKVRFGVNEVISTLMLNYVAAEFVQHLVIGPWKGKTQFGFPYTDDFPESATLGLLGYTRIHPVTMIIALATIVVLALVIYRTRFGYEVRVCGENPDAARYAGINVFRLTVVLMAVSGGIAGLAGVGEVAGVHHHLSYPYTISAGYGFTAIIVAWLSKLNPFFVIVSGLFFAGIKVGGDAIQLAFGLPAATVEVFNGIILFFLIMGDYFTHHSVRIRRRSREI
jgi:general nucleoside transport system permease protein